MKVLLVGGGGREAAFALKLAAEGCAVFAVMPHANPTICDCAQAGGGAWKLADCNNAAAIADFAEEHGADYAFVSADEPLANGVVDGLLARGIRAIGGVAAATQIEWDKIYAMRLVQEVAPQLAPQFFVANSPAEAEAAIAKFAKNNAQVVVKPRGLTGGKGVKVMPQHLPSYEACLQYAKEAGKDGEEVLITEKLQGQEFTIMAFCDGEAMAFCPATCDYPYRFVGDEGPGTGGMGCYTAGAPELPFMTPQDTRQCHALMRAAAAALAARGRRFVGVLNGGFFITPNGPKFMEFNARFGDPEALNIMAVLKTPFSRVLPALWRGELAKLGALEFASESSVVKYVVAKEYPQASPQATEFAVDAAASAGGLQVALASATRAPAASEANRYVTLKKSRVLAVTGVGKNRGEVAKRINNAIERHIIKGNAALAYRPDIAL